MAEWKSPLQGKAAAAGAGAPAAVMEVGAAMAVAALVMAKGETMPCQHEQKHQESKPAPK